MGEASIIAHLASQFGPTGLIIGFLVWNKLTIEKDRMNLDRERVEADKQLAASLAALKTAFEMRDDK